MVSKLQRLLVLAALGTLLALAACSEDSTGPGQNHDPSDTTGADTSCPQLSAVASIAITGPSQGQVGQSMLLTAATLNSTGGELSCPVAWTSSDTTLIFVGSNGAVTPRRIGSVVIRAVSGARRDSLVFTSSLEPYTFVFADTAPEAERRLIRDGIQDAHFFHRLVFEKTLTDSVTVSGVYAANGCAAGGAAAFASGRAVTFCLGNPGWKTHGPVIKQKIVQHELFHLWQFAHWSAEPGKSPAWLIEGTAELMGYYGVAHRGRITMEVALGCQRKESADFATNQPPGLPPLQNVESRQAFQSTMGPLYTHSMLAAHYLAEEGDGLAALETYGDVVKTNATWQTAFQQAFALSPAAFYSQFPGYVSGLTVPPTYLCRI